MKVTADDLHVARLAALAIVLALIDNSIPAPLPGVKPGLANIVVLFALYRYGWRVAVSVSLLRVFGAALVVGSLLTPGFFLSLSGALCSLLALRLALWLPARWFGPVSASLLAAVSHLAGQLLVVRLWLIPSDQVVYFLPFFSLAGLITGLVNGLIAARLLDQPTAPKDLGA